MIQTSTIMLVISSFLSFFGVVYAIDIWLLIFSSSLIKRRPHKIEVKCWPKVSIHIPLYNEENVAARILNACLNLDYPKDKIEIIVLDDSNDETTSIVKEFEKKKPNLIKVIHRNSREGFKAGALQNALKYTTGEIIALFDADHVPSRDFLKKLIPYLLADKNIAFVQTKFNCLNFKENWIVKSIAIASEFYNKINLNGRAKLDFLLHFRGGGGIFKRNVLEEVGGWQSDTLAEDLDLSIRLFLAGKKGVYISEETCLEEMPATLLDLIRQQQRWVKGFAQCFKKHAFSIIKSEKISLLKKFDALIYLSTCFAYPLAFFGLIFGFFFSQIFPQNFILANLFKNYVLTFNFSANILSYSAFLTAMSLTLFSKEFKVNFLKILYVISLVLILIPILIFTNSIAVIEAFIKKKHIFYRTRKIGGSINNFLILSNNNFIHNLKKPIISFLESLDFPKLLS